MSAPKRAVVLSPEAQVDYDDILLYSLLTWGDDQMRQYQIALDQAIDHLVQYPEFGERRDDLCAGCRFLPVERHVVCYRIETDAIQIVRIIHRRADAARYLPR
ncbi:MAG: type II toxin-antitoxin system RelE/ParE family toxin [Thermomicrobiales bacterium]